MCLNHTHFSFHERVASSIVEKKMVDFNKKLWSYELTIKDIEALDEDKEGGGTCRGIVYPLGVSLCHMNWNLLC